MKNTINKSIKLVVISCLAVFISSASLFAQQTKNVIFRQANIAKGKAEIMQAHILTPTEFQKAVDFYEDAEKRFDRQRGIEKVEELLTSAVNHFNRAVDFSVSAKIVFAN